MNNITRENFKEYVYFHVTGKFVEKVIEDFRNKLNGISYTRSDVFDLFMNTFDEDMEQISSLILQPAEPPKPCVIAPVTKVTSVLKTKATCRITKYGNGGIRTVFTREDVLDLKIDPNYKYYVGEYLKESNTLKILLYMTEVVPLNDTVKVGTLSRISGSYSGPGFVITATNLIPQRIRDLMDTKRRYDFPTSFDKIEETIYVDFSSLPGI